MIKLKSYLVFFFLVLCFTISFGQTNVSGFEVNLQEKTPQSPNAGGLGRYFDIPVNMATGIPDISIPLYVIKSGNITIPVSLSYHAGGIQVNDIAGWVGLGWTLSTGGSVVKKTNGLDDFYAATGIGSGSPNQNYTAPDYSFIPYNAGYTNMTDAIADLPRIPWMSSAGIDSIYHFFGFVTKGFLDAEADEFMYSMPGGGGKFYYNQKQTKFQLSSINGSIVSGDAGGWTITTNDGKVYQFYTPELTVNPSWLKSLSSQTYLTTAWYLNSISDPATGKEVNFTYDNYYKSNVPMGVAEIHDYDFTSGPPTNAGTTFVDNLRTGDNMVPGTIRFDEGTVYFIKDATTRPDYGPNALKEIKIYNAANLLLKKFNLDYFTSSSRLFLKSLQETEYNGYGDSLKHPAYLFTYDTATHLPARFSYAQDKWGYYNGKTSNTTSIPSHPYSVYYPSLLAADRRVDSNYTKAGMLNGMVLPTGGKTVFAFENNRIITDSLVGGMRIKKIIHTDSVAAKNIITEYRYISSNGYSSGESVTSPVFNYDLYYQTGSSVPGDLFYFHSRIRTESTPANSLFPNQGSPIFYSVVEKRQKSSGGDLLSRHYFQRLVEPGETYTNMIGVPHPKELEVSGLPEYMTEIYKRINDSTYSLIQSDFSGFGTIVSTQNAIWNAQAAWSFTEPGFIEWPGGDPMIYYPMWAYILPSMHAYKWMPAANVSTYQSSSTVSNGVTLTVPTYSEYDSTNGNLKLTKTVDSKGDTTIRMIKYACDYISTSLPGVNYEILYLNTYNMKAAPVEIIALLRKKDSANSTVQSALLYEYDGLKVKKVYKVFDQVPYSSFTVSYNDESGFYKDSHYKLEQEVTAWDDEGRPRTVITNTNQATYTWDEKYQQPTSVVSNASYADVGYTSFEGQSNGGWTVSSATRDSAYFITGRKCYQLSNGSPGKSGLNSGTIYTVSYWSRNGSYTVSGSASIIQGRTIDGWTYYEHIVSGVSSVTVSGSGYLDELRIYPKAAQMTSFCYEELLGITSQCDIANHITYYQYYGPDKLKLVKDQDKNIIKTFDYKYREQQ